VARYPAFAVEVDDPGVLIDVDTPQDLAQARLARSAGLNQPAGTAAD
jgi:CTP:molybdopterin cytidylyltransferase MocA